MAKKAVRFNKKAFEDLRKSHGVREDLLRRARKVAAAAGGEAMGYKVTPLVLEDPRGAVSVMATGKARTHNRKHRSLVRALAAARG